MKNYYLLVLLAAGVFCFATPVYAQTLVNFQGQIDSPSDSTVQILFELFDSEDSNSPLWFEDRMVSVSEGGVFHVLLGSDTSFGNLFSARSELYLQLQVEDQVLSPRYRLTSVPYAYRATVADALIGGINVPGNSISDFHVVDNSLSSASLGANSVGTSELVSSIALTPNGRLDIENSSGSIRGTMTPNTADGGLFRLRSSDGQDAVLATTGGGGTYGVVSLYGENNDEITTLSRSSGGAGFFRIRSDDGDEIIRITQNAAKAGSMSIWNGNDTNNSATISMDGSTGNLALNGTKSFRMQHPLDPSKEIYYVALEGPEAGVYIRGTGELVDGEAIIALPEHFTLVTNDEGITVQVTPLSAGSEGLAVVSKSASKIEVKELMEGRGSYEFDYIVHGVRTGYENFQVVRSIDQAGKTGELGSSGGYGEDAVEEVDDKEVEDPE